MSPAEALISDTKAISDFLDQQRAILGTSADDVFVAQKDACSRRIAAVPQLTPTDAMKLTDVIKTSVWCDNHKAELAAAIATRLAAGATGACGLQRRTNQTCPSVSTYLKQSDIDFINAHPTGPAVQRMVEVYVSVGMLWPTESLVRHGIATLVQIGLPGLAKTPSTLHNLVRDFKTKLKQVKRMTRWTFDHIVVYPPTPAGLPGLVWQHAYAAEPPANITAEVFEIERCIALRRNSAILVPTPSTLVEAGAPQMHPMMLACMRQMASLMQGAGGGRPMPNLTLFSPRGAMRMGSGNPPGSGVDSEFDAAGDGGGAGGRGPLALEAPGAGGSFEGASGMARGRDHQLALEFPTGLAPGAAGGGAGAPLRDGSTGALPGTPQSPATTASRSEVCCMVSSSHNPPLGYLGVGTPF